MTFFLQELLNGLVSGSTYALVALGFTLIFGVLRVLNLAHPDIFMWGAFCALVATGAGLPGWLVAVVAVLGSAAWGLVIDRLVLRRLRTSALATPFIATMGVSIFLQNLAVRVFGPQPRPFPRIISNTSFAFGGLEFSTGRLITVGSALLLMVALWVMVERTWLGKAIRATSEDAEMARALGIDAEFVSLLTIVIASGFAGVAGFLIASLYNQVFPYMGLTIGLKAMVVMVVGGLGNAAGAVLGGFVLGALESLTVGYLSSSYTDAVAFLSLLVVLVLRPQGLLGERLRRR